VRNITSQHKSYEGKPAAHGTFPALFPAPLRGPRIAMRSPARAGVRGPGSLRGHRPGLTHRKFRSAQIWHASRPSGRTRCIL